MSGFEIYGAMSEEEKGQESGAGTLTFLPSYDFDTNGVVYWLGTNRGTENWQNPGMFTFVCFVILCAFFFFVCLGLFLCPFLVAFFNDLKMMCVDSKCF